MNCIPKDHEDINAPSHKLPDALQMPSGTGKPSIDATPVAEAASFFLATKTQIWPLQAPEMILFWVSM